MLDMSVMNAYHLYLVKTGKRPSIHKFSQSIIMQLIEKFPHQRATIPGAIIQVRRLHERHFLVPVPPTASNQRARLRCHVCGTSSRKPKKVQKTYFMCKECNVGLCVYPCFPEYHTLKIY